VEVVLRDDPKTQVMVEIKAEEKKNKFLK